MQPAIDHKTARSAHVPQGPLRPRRRTLAFAAVLLLGGVWGWQTLAHPHDVHAELRRRLIEAELGSASFFNFASPVKAPDGSLDTTGNLLADLRSALPDTRWDAASALAWRGNDERVVDALIRAMRDPAGTRRVCVMAKALGRLHDPRAIGPLTRAAFDPGNEDLRVCAIQSLGMIGDARAAPALIAALDARNMPTEAARALARLGDARAVLPIARAAADPALRLWMIESLGELGSPAGLPYLSLYASDASPVREAVVEARWKIGVLASSARLPALTQVLTRDADAAHRMWAAWRLGESRDVHASLALAQALSDHNDSVRGRAAAALVRIGQAALPAVRGATQTGPAEARAWALAVVGYLGNAGDAAWLESQEPRLPAKLAAIARRSAQLIRHFTAFHEEASGLARLDALPPSTSVTEPASR